jgi:hypothetical protein
MLMCVAKTAQTGAVNPRFSRTGEFTSRTGTASAICELAGLTPRSPAPRVAAHELERISSRESSLALSPPRSGDSADF